MSNWSLIKFWIYSKSEKDFTLFFYILAPVIFFTFLIILTASYQGELAKSVLEIDMKDLQNTLQPLRVLLKFHHGDIKDASTMIEEIIQAVKTLQNTGLDSSSDGEGISPLSPGEK